MPIIDVHTHLGDILYSGGGDLIFAGPVKKEFGLDLITLSEWIGHRMTWYRDHVVARYLKSAIVAAERRRNFTASLANMALSMEKTGVTRSVCMPIAPYVTFADLSRAAGQDERIVPFTSPDFSGDPERIAGQIARDAAAGARGMKLHSIIQKEPLAGEKTVAAVTAAGRAGLPVLVHTGVSTYYYRREGWRQDPSLGDIPLIESLVADFPRVSFIIGHAGLYQTGEVMRRLAGRSNAQVDISFQSAAVVRRLMAAFGPERVMFASDWPFGNPGPMVRIVKAACRGDRALEQMIFHDNAARLLGL